ncbi:MAG: hypothetical protein NTY68_00200 [Candidatus Micrarchaeota archaeon]|nr:hypothetical protein [Candidatus Micrarchaeota archaeon]
MDKMKIRGKGCGRSMANKSNVFLFVTHSFSRETIDEFRKIRIAARGIGPCFILYHKKDGMPINHEILSLPHFIFTDKDISDLGDAPYFRKPINGKNGNTDLAIIKFFMENKYSHYWHIEYDVRFSGNWKDFFSYFSKAKEDFLACHIRRHNEERDWELWPMTAPSGKKAGTAKALRSFNPIYRISRRALNYIFRMYQKGWSGHNEALIPTLLYQGGFSLRDFGGSGKFVLAQDMNRFYTDSTTFHLYDGTMRCRPLHPFMFGVPKNKLIHPVKQLGMINLPKVFASFLFFKWKRTNKTRSGHSQH